MEKIETLNQRLIDHYGIYTSTGQPMFRIVWADDQTETRMVQNLESGVELLYPIPREVKKYNYLKDVYVLEQLVVVPEMNRLELMGLKLSYEPLWAYSDKDRNPVPPQWDATKFIVDAMYAAMGKKSLRKYIEDISPEAQEKRITGLQEELFGNENDTTDALAYREGVVVPPTYKPH